MSSSLHLLSAAQLDDDCIVTGSRDHTLRLWSVYSGDCLRVFDGRFDGMENLKSELVHHTSSVRCVVRSLSCTAHCNTG